MNDRLTFDVVSDNANNGGTHWLQKYNLLEVQYMAGHRYVSTTEGYKVNNIEDLVKNIEEYHPIG